MSNYERLKKVYDEVEGLINARVTSRSNEFNLWKHESERVLIDIYGVNSIEYQNFRKIVFHLSALERPNIDYVNKCIFGLKNAKSLFKLCLGELRPNA